ncbi:MAG: MATE family efflux transporter [Eubacteriales bacterium]|nr:MATE family efflux transporter [Eubacteriales bacterium]
MIGGMYQEMSNAVKVQKKQMMLEENIRSVIFKMAVPTIVAQLITTIYNLVDTFFVSTLGTNATAAVGVNGSLERTISLLGALIATGASSYISRLLGVKRDEDAERVLSTSFYSGVVLAVVFMAIGRLLINPMVYWLGATPDCAEYSIQYATYVLYAAPALIGSFILNMSMRSEGSATYAMVGIGFGGILNCFLDPLFIYGLNLGVAGASMATAIFKYISFFILLYLYARKKSAVAISLQKIKFVAHDVKEVLAIGSTSFFRTALQVAASVVMNRVAGGFSTAALAALSVANRVMEFPFAIILGFGQGYQPVVGYNWGAKQAKRVQESLSFSVMTSLVGAVVMGAVLFVTAGKVVYIFNSEADAEVLRIGILCIQLQCIAMPFHAWGSIVNMFYAGVGKAKNALLLSTARQGYCFIPVAVIAPLLFRETGVAATQAIADVLSLAVTVPLGILAFRMAKKL